MSGNFKDWKSWTKNASDKVTGKVNDTTKDWDKNSKEFVEEIRVNSKNLVSEVERLLKESEVRRLRIRQGDRIMLDIPVAWAAIGALLAPPIAAVGAIAAVASDCVIEVTRVVPADAPTPRPAPAQPQASQAKPQPQAQAQQPYGSRPNPGPNTNPKPNTNPSNSNNNPNIPKTPDDLSYR